MKKKQKTVADFNVRLHLIGRIWTLIGILLFVSVPVTIALYYDAKIDWTIFASAAVISPMILNLLAGIGEPIIYAPMLGTNGMYLAFITGNLSNLKIPCVVKAQEIVGTKMGTEENEIVSTIAIATSTLVTTLIIAIFVALLGAANLAEVISQYEFIYPAFGCVVYALFGSLGGKYMAKNPKLAIFPTIIIVVLSVILAFGGSALGSVNLFVGIALCLVFAGLQYARESKKMKLKEETRRLEAIAAGISYERLLEIEKQQKLDAEAERLAKAEAKKKAKSKK